MAGKFGKSGLLLSSSGEITADRNGLWTGACLFTFDVGRVDQVPAIGSVHPNVSFLVAERFRIIFTPGRWTVSVDYVGANADDTDPQYELSPGTGNEPIEAHDKFLSTIAGKPSAPLNHAIFRNPETGEISTDDAPGMAVFDRFSVYKPDGTLNPFAGQEMFISQNNTVWTKTWTRRSKPAAHKIRIGTPDGDAPDYGGGTNWLELPIAYTKRGRVYSCTARWIASGPRGWNPIVYPA